MTAIDAAANRFTPQDLLRLEGGDGLFELVDGNLVGKNVSWLSGETAVIAASRLYVFASRHESGALCSHTTFNCFPDKPNQVRRPNIAFIATARLPQVPDEGHIPIAPDLAVEIVSSDDLVYELDSRIQDYKSAGVPLIWVINPKRRTLRVYEHGRLKAELEEHEEVRGEPVLAGFSARVSELIPERAPTSSV